MNNNQKIIFTAIKEVIITTCPQCHSIYRFGSWATENQTKSGDLDIALLLPGQKKGVSCKDKPELSLSLAQIAEVETVDIIDIRQVDTIFQMQIIDTGQRYDMDDGDEASLFEMTTLSLYQKLNDERDEILQAGIKRGRFYHV